MTEAPNAAPPGAAPPDTETLVYNGIQAALVIAGLFGVAVPSLFSNTAFDHQLAVGLVQAGGAISALVGALWSWAGHVRKNDQIQTLKAQLVFHRRELAAARAPRA